MGIHLGRAVPVSLDEEGVLLLEFEPGAENAFTFFQNAGNREAVEAFLHEVTSNIRTVRMRQAPPVVVPPAATVAPETTQTAASRTAAFDEYLNNPGVAAVINEFKGVIVDVQKAAPETGK